MSYLQKTEEAFVLSSLKEFVKVWGSGGQAHLKLHCHNREAWVKLSFQLGSPAGNHYVPHPTPQRDQPHVPPDHSAPRTRPRKQKGPSRREKDRTRAAAHRARIEQLNNSPPPAAPAGGSPPPPAAPEGGLPPPPAASVSGPPPPAASVRGPPSKPVLENFTVTAVQPPRRDHQSAVPAGEHSLQLQHLGAASAPGNCDVLDELCPDDYFTYLQEQKKKRDMEIKNLEKFQFGFKPTNTRKPF